MGSVKLSNDIHLDTGSLPAHACPLFQPRENATFHRRPLRNIPADLLSQKFRNEGVTGV